MRRGAALKKRPRLVAGLVLIVAILAVAGVVLGGRFGGEELASGSSGEERTGTDTVERRTLVDTESVEGTFGYGGERAVINHLGDGAGGGGGDTVAWDGNDGAMTYFASDEAPPTGNDDEDDDECGDDDSDDNDDTADDRDSGQRTTDSGDNADADADDDACDDDKSGDDDKGPDSDGGSDDAPSGGTPSGRNGTPSGGTPSGGSPTASGGDGGTGNGGDGGTGDGGGNGGGGSTNSNTLTSAARAGTVVRRGGVLYRVDDDPVVLMYGDTPAWRDMQPGISKGRDVAQLEQNLKQLGYTDDGFEPDGTYDSTTAAAVRRWQEDKGLSKTGTVEHGRVVFMAGARRAGTRTADIGASLTDGTEVLKTTSTTRLVKVELEVSKQSIVKEGDPVTVTLPGGRTAKGRIRSVGRVAHEADSGDSGGGGGDPGGDGSGSTDPVLDMTVALSSTKGLNRLDEAPVTVNLARETRKQALSVPVTALLAQPGGGYAVETVAADGTKQLREVEPGLFAGGYVEIAEGSVKDGDRVTVPAA